MADVGSLAVKLLLDAAQFQKEIEAQTTRAQKLGSQLNDIGGKLTSTGKGLTAAVTLPLLGVGVAAIDAASDLDESLSKVGVVFGENADAIVAWSADAAEAFGQSQQQALEAAGTYGNLLTAIGITGPAAAKMSTTFVELASDLASFNNASPEETLLALRSALTGEFEPLKRFGVALNQAAIQAKALELGLDADVNALDPAAKAQLAYALILEQTQTAQGDFARTSEGLANQTRILQAQFKDQAAALGRDLLPIALQVVGVIRDLLSRFQELSPEQQKQILVFAGIAAAIGPVLIVIGSLVSAIGTIITVGGAVVGALGTVAAILTGPVGIALGAVVLAVIALKAAWESNFLGIATFAEDWKATIEKLFDAFRALFTGDWEGFLLNLEEVWDDTWFLIKETGKIVWDNIRKFFTETDWAAIGQTILEKVATGIGSGTRFIIDAAKAAVRKAIQSLAEFLGIDLNDVGLGFLTAGGGSNSIAGAANQTVSPAANQVTGQAAGGAGFHLHLTTMDPPNVVHQFEVLKALSGA